MKRLCLAVLCGAACLAAARAQTPEIQDRTQTILYLQKLQTKAGGFQAAAPDAKATKLPKPSLRATSSAVRALKYLGGKVPDKDACVRFVEGCFDKASGGFADVPGGKADVFSTAVGLMAVVELKMPVEPYGDRAVKYLGENARAFEDVRIAVAGLEALKARLPQAQAAAWGEVVAAFGKEKARDTGFARAAASSAVTRLRLGEEVKHRDEVLKRLKEGQLPDGGYGKEDARGSDLESTYRVMRAFHMLKDRPDVARLRGFLAKCRNADGGYGIAPGQPSTVGGTYFVAIIEHWLKEK